MSLINQALKKAQRQRAEADGSLGMFAQSGRGLGRSKGLSMQTMILGGLALVTLSVVLTVMLVSRKSDPKPAAKQIASAPAAALAQVPPPSAAVPLPSPAVTISLPPPSQPPQPAASEEPIKPAPVPVAAAPADETPVQAPPESKPSPTIVFPHHDDAIQAIVDGLQVTGYRALGADSKVIIAGKIIRINNVVDHASGLRLTKVDPMSLTFVDASGETYVRNF